MAASNSTPNQTLIATIIAIFFLMILSKVQSLNDLTFKFDKFVPNQPNLIFQGDASVSPTTGVLQLTSVAQPLVRSSIGRVLYATPLQIRDSTTGEKASFLTSFSFLLNATKENRTSDGLTFFLAPVNSQIPSGTQSGYFGLFNRSSYDSSSQIVAVEFDTFSNPWDRDYKHIGININSIQSQNWVKWDWQNGEVANVIITYQASTHTLSVSQYYPWPSDGTSAIVTHPYVLDSFLPEWVSIGFSAGVIGPDDFETHDILSWYFTTNDVLTAAAIEKKETNVFTAR